MVTQLTGMIGQVGVIAAAVPMTAALSSFGWGRTFGVSGAIGVLLGAVLFVVVRDAPGGIDSVSGRVPLSAVRSELRASWAEPGTRLGLWTHFTAQFSVTVFTLLWGFPYLTESEGVSATTAGVLITTTTLSAVVVGPLLGTLVSRRPYHRSTLVLLIVATIVAAWTVVLAWPGGAPLAVLVVLMVAMGMGGQAAMIGFDFVRSFNPGHRLGGASGIVNQGGFVATLLVIVAIGLVLDALTPADAQGYSAEAFTAAMCTQYVAWAVGVAQIVRYRGRARRRMAATDPEAFAAIRPRPRARNAAHLR